MNDERWDDERWDEEHREDPKLDLEAVLAHNSIWKRNYERYIFAALSLEALRQGLNPIDMMRHPPRLMASQAAHLALKPFR